MKSLSKPEKTRVVVFMAVSLLSVVFVVWFAWGLCDMMTAPLIGYDDVGEISIDGEDRTGFFLLCAVVVNGIAAALCFAAAPVYVILAAAGAALSGVLLRVITVKTADNIGSGELGLIRKTFIAASAAQAVIPALIITGYIITGGSGFGLAGLLLCWQYPLFMRLIYINKVKRLAADAG